MSGQGARRPRKRGRKKGAQEQCVGPNPTDRAKSGVKKSVLVEGNGRPLAVAISGANIPDGKLLKATLDAVVVARPAPTTERPQHLCLDKGYDNAPAEAVVTGAGYVPHIKRIGEEKLDTAGEKTHPARRWVVERTFSWLANCRGILVRYDKLAARYLALIKLASGLLWFRRWYELDPTLTF